MSRNSRDIWDGCEIVKRSRTTYAEEVVLLVGDESWVGESEERREVCVGLGGVDGVVPHGVVVEDRRCGVKERLEFREEGKKNAFSFCASILREVGREELLRESGEGCEVCGVQDLSSGFPERGVAGEESCCIHLRGERHHVIERH